MWETHWVINTEGWGKMTSTYTATSANDYSPFHYSFIERVQKKCVERFSYEQYERILESRTYTTKSPLPSWGEVNFEHTTKRKYVFVGARSSPFALSKSVWIALKGHPESVTVKISSVGRDEEFFLDDIFQNRDCPTRCAIYNHPHIEDEKFQGWMKALDESTHIVVYGGEETVEYYKKRYPEKELIIHGPKFSFGVVTHDDVPRSSSRIWKDFSLTMGEGCLSPRFYFILGGKPANNHENTRYLGSHSQRDNERDFYQDHLPLGEKSNLAQGWFHCEFDLTDEIEVPDHLYGGMKFYWNEDRTEEDVIKFAEAYRGQISTVAIGSHLDLLHPLSRVGVPRVCPIGDMQTPDFTEQYDEQYDWRDFLV